jgi:site-specific DNA recombinase
MNIAAYCRVSTDKADQLNSLETQKRFFREYTERSGDTLVRLYADEGISGTKTKNRTEFLRLMRDAERGVFDMVVVKDISRFARNTVDLLQNIRRLKELGIQTLFLTANMTSMGNSEFVLTIFGALAQEESANTSKRIKFGKAENAKRGKVPNLVYGYDKTAGDYFSLTVNEARGGNSAPDIRVVCARRLRQHKDSGDAQRKRREDKARLPVEPDLRLPPALK